MDTLLSDKMSQIKNRRNGTRLRLTVGGWPALGCVRCLRLRPIGGRIAGFAGLGLSLMGEWGSFLSFLFLVTRSV